MPSIPDATATPEKANAKYGSRTETYADFNRPHSTVFYLFAKTNQSYSNPLKSRLPCDHAHADDRFVPSFDRDSLTFVADPLFLPHLTNSPALDEVARRGCYRKMNAGA